MVRLSPYKQVFEAHQGSFLEAGYSGAGTSALAQAAVAKPVTETAFDRPARYFAYAIPHAKSLLDFDQYEHRYSPIFSKWKIWAVGKVNDQRSWSLLTQHFHRREFQVGSFQAITLRAACRSVRATIASVKVLRARRAA